jgi:hypothetical protein
MAYGIYLVATEDKIIDEIQYTGSPVSARLVVKLIEISHSFVSYGSNIKEFDRYFIDAIENGKVLNKCFWHPLRSPVFFKSDRVFENNLKLKNEWKMISLEYSEDELYWYLIDFQQVFDFFEYASKNNLGVISFLSKTFDERSDKIIYPINFL